MHEPLPTAPATYRTTLSILAALTILAVLILGYHPGLEDDAFYLAAIKSHLNPALFPHDSQFFRLQFQATIFDKLIAYSVRLTHLSVSWAVFLWQLSAIFFLLHGTWQIARRCFPRPEAQWSAVATIAVLLSMPLPGIAISLADQYLHPRILAAALILAAIVAALDRRYRRSGILLAVAFSIHAIMACFGISFCLFLYWQQHAVRERHPAPTPVLVASLLSLGWLFEPASDAWRQAAATRGFYYLLHWHWYEWFGIFAPLALLLLFAQFLSRRNQTDQAALPTLVSSLIYYGIFQTCAGLLIMLPPSLERLRPFESMRYLYLLYFLFFLIAGGLLGRFVLHRRVLRWALVFLPLSAAMFYAQYRMFPSSSHLELPGRTSQNAWLQAFTWIRHNTPVDSFFALDPHYMTLPGEDYHGFRALAERSVLADYEKDGGMAARVPRIAPLWWKEVNAENGWQKFQAADFERLRNEFGVNWVVLARAESNPAAFGMTCPYQHDQLQVCRLY